MRCAVLLDSLRAPRASPPLADVLRLLHDNYVAENCADCCSSSGGKSVASLGLLRLDGSGFLVNRLVLARRIDEILLNSPAAFTYPAGSATPAPVSRDNTVSRACTTIEGYPSDSPKKHARMKTKETADALEPSSMGSDPPPRGSTAHEGQYDFALLDVRESLPRPVVVTNVLAPRLCEALHSIFKDPPAIVQTRKNTDLPPPMKPLEVNPTTPSAPSTITGGEGVGGGGSLAPSEGAQWLLDWNNKVLELGSCGELRRILGDVGLSGLAGWILEYPVIYCCPSLRQWKQDEIGAETDSIVVGNCLAESSLMVYSFRIELGRKSDSVLSCEAFSFSVPEEVFDPTPVTEGGDSKLVGQGQKVAFGLNSLVDKFLDGVQRRIEPHTRNTGDEVCCQRNRQQWLNRLSVNKRIERLDRVAL